MDEDSSASFGLDQTAKPPRKRQRPKGLRRASDRELHWVEDDYPQLHVWRELARDWLKGETEAVHVRLAALTAFLEKYLVYKKLPLEPSVLLSRQTQLPDFYAVACPDSNAGIAYNNIINSFLNWVLLRDFSVAADDGHLVISPVFRNPVSRMTRGGTPRLDESVHSPLPYGYIDELRSILAAGPHFKDWEWARNVSGPGIGKGGIVAPDWFPVVPSNIDEDDPDCVWRLRPLANDKPPVLEIWSPVRWVALLTKLILPLRTMQVRLLDSEKRTRGALRMATGR